MEIQLASQQKEKSEEGAAVREIWEPKKRLQKIQTSGVQKDAKEPGCWERHIQRRNMGKT